MLSFPSLLMELIVLEVERAFHETEVAVSGVDISLIGC